MSSINRAIPPEYVQDLVEQVFEEAGKYVTGERDEFTVTIQAGEQVETLVQEVKALLRKADAYSLLYEGLVTRLSRMLWLRSCPSGWRSAANGW